MIKKAKRHRKSPALCTKPIPPSREVDVRFQRNMAPGVRGRSLRNRGESLAGISLRTPNTPGSYSGLTAQPSDD